VYLNGVKLVAGTDFTATNGTSITLATGAAVNDVVDIVAYGTFVLADHYTEAQSDARYVQVAGDTMTGNLDITGTLTSDGLTVGAPNGLVLDTSGATEASWTHNPANGESTISVGRNAGWGGDLNINTDTLRRMRIQNNGDISFYEDTGTTPKFFWDASAESLGIGTSSPSDKLHVQSSGDTKLKVETTGTTAASGHSGLSLNTGNGGYLLQNLTTADSTHGVLRIYDTANSAERMRIDSSGNLILGGTSAGQDGAVTLSNTGYIQARIDNDTVAYFDRTGAGDDGEVIRIQQNGATVGSIGSSASGQYLHIGSDDVGLTFAPNVDSIIPFNVGTGAYNANVDLGYSAGTKFRNIYLNSGVYVDTGGGVYLGGTGAANKLDDYEEGTWTPTWQTSNGDLSGFSNSSQIGTYTKIGNTVRIFFQLSTSNAASITGTGGIVVLGLPFSADDQSNAGVPVMVKTHDSRFLNDPYGVAEIQANATRIKLFKTQAMNNANALTVADMTKTNAGNYNLISGTCVYKTSS
jgi:hypothetical protein